MGHNDADWNTFLDDSKATRGYIFNISGWEIYLKYEK